MEKVQDHDHSLQPNGGLAGELTVRLVDCERARVGERTERAGRVVRAAAEREHRVVVPDLRAREQRGRAQQRVRRLVDDVHDVARPGEGARGQQDQVVGTRTQDDLLRSDAGVVRDRVEERGEAAVRVALDLGQRGREHLGACVVGRCRRRVPVEPKHLVRLDVGDARGLCRRHRPGEGREARGKRPHDETLRRAGARAAAGVG